MRSGGCVAWLLVGLMLHTACVGGRPRGAPSSRDAERWPQVTYDVAVLELGGQTVGPSNVAPSEFQHAVRRLSGTVRWTGTPHETARALLEVKGAPLEGERVEMSGEWRAEGMRAASTRWSR